MGVAGSTELKPSFGEQSPDAPPDAEASSLRQGWDEVGAGLFDVVSFFDTWRAIMERPERMVEPPDKALKVSPLTFAVQGALLLYLITSSMGWFADVFQDISFSDRRIYARQMTRLESAVVAARTPEAKAKALRAQRAYKWELKGAELSENAAKAATAPSYLAGACVFEWFLRRLRGRYPRTARAYDAFLYEITVRGFVPTAVLLLSVSYLMLWGELDALATKTGGTAGTLTLMSVIGYLSGIVWMLVSYVIMGRSLCRLFGLPTNAREMTREDKAARRRVGNGFLLGLAAMAAVTYAAAFGTSWAYISLRHLLAGGAG
jgi:hypothetical protein